MCFYRLLEASSFFCFFISFRPSSLHQVNQNVWQNRSDRKATEIGRWFKSNGSKINQFEPRWPHLSNKSPFSLSNFHPSKSDRTKRRHQQTVNCKFELCCLSIIASVKISQFENRNNQACRIRLLRSLNCFIFLPDWKSFKVGAI